MKLTAAIRNCSAFSPATDPASIVILTDRLGIVATYPAYEAHAALEQFVKASAPAFPAASQLITVAAQSRQSASSDRPSSTGVSAS